MFNHRKLRCYQMSLETAQRVPRLIARWPRGMYYLVDQLRRAVASITLNIAEGNGRTSPKDRARFFGFARASAAEASSIIDIASALNLADKVDVEFFEDRFLQIVKILYKLK